MSTQYSSHPALSGADAIAASTSDFMLLCARILLGWIFIRSGYGKLFNIPGVAASFPARGIPSFMAYISVPVEFLGGIALLLGLATRYVAVLMALFMVIATLISHRYWDFTEAAVRRAQEGSFWKNAAILGGFFSLFVSGGGGIGLDGWLRRRH
jgi:putative oxidoreductase